MNGKLIDHNTYISGIVDGFPIIIEKSNPYYLITVNAVSEEDENNAALSSYVGTLKDSNNKIIDIRRYAYSIRITVNEKKSKNLAETLNGILNAVLDYLKDQNYAGCCEESGAMNSNIEVYEINGHPHYLCAESADGIYQSLKSTQESVLAEKSQLIPGIVGALFGSLIGVALWVIIYRLGFISALAGMVMGVCSLKGYELLGKKLDTKGVIVCIVIMLGMVYLANKLAWTLDAYSVLKQYDWSFSECFREMNYILDTLDLTGDYIRDLVMGYALTALGSFSLIWNAMKSSRGSFSFKK